MARDIKIDYDRDEDILWLYDGRKAKDSLELGNYIIDFAKNDVVGIEILNASEVLSRLSSKQISKSMLENILNAKLKVHFEKDLLFVIAILRLSDAEVKDLHVQIDAPKQVMMVTA